MSNTSIEVLDGIEKACGKRLDFKQIDLKDKTKVTHLFENKKPEEIEIEKIIC